MNPTLMWTNPELRKRRHTDEVRVDDILGLTDVLPVVHDLNAARSDAARMCYHAPGGTMR